MRVMSVVTKDKKREQVGVETGEKQGSLTSTSITKPALNLPACMYPLFTSATQLC